ncbi:MAG: molybdenum cofactor synthesis domain-containing protein [Armatimonadota bacterium]
MSNNGEIKGRVVSVNISDAKGTVKRPAASVRVSDRGIEGDAHAGAWHRQVSLLSQESIEAFAKLKSRSIAPGEFAENLTLQGVDTASAAVLDRFRIGSVELQVTQIGKSCHGTECAIFREVGECMMPKEGLFCRVLSGGTISAGDAVEYIPKTLDFRVITLSDRAYRGEYADKSGPEVRRMLDEFLAGKRWHPQFGEMVLPDDPKALRSQLIAARDEGADVVFTTGGTGVGPRDFTPETVADVCDKLIPGIMEHVRMKYGAVNPNALLSRSVAGVAGRTLIFALPGSVRAVREYMSEILTTLEHLVFMVHGLDNH